MPLLLQALGGITSADRVSCFPMGSLILQMTSNDWAGANDPKIWGQLMSAVSGGVQSGPGDFRPKIFWWAATPPGAGGPGWAYKLSGECEIPRFTQQEVAAEGPAPPVQQTGGGAGGGGGGGVRAAPTSARGADGVEGAGEHEGEPDALYSPDVGTRPGPQARTHQPPATCLGGALGGDDSDPYDGEPDLPGRARDRGPANQGAVMVPCQGLYGGEIASLQQELHRLEEAKRLKAQLHARIHKVRLEMDYMDQVALSGHLQRPSSWQRSRGDQAQGDPPRGSQSGFKGRGGGARDLGEGDRSWLEEQGWEGRGKQLFEDTEEAWALEGEISEGDGYDFPVADKPPPWELEAAALPRVGISQRARTGHRQSHRGLTPHTPSTLLPAFGPGTEPSEVWWEPRSSCHQPPTGVTTGGADLRADFKSGGTSSSSRKLGSQGGHYGRRMGPAAGDQGGHWGIDGSRGPTAYDRHPPGSRGGPVAAALPLPPPPLVNTRLGSAPMVSAQGLVQGVPSGTQAGRQGLGTPGLGMSAPRSSTGADRAQWGVDPTGRRPHSVPPGPAARPCGASEQRKRGRPADWLEGGPGRLSDLPEVRPSREPGHTARSRDDWSGSPGSVAAGGRTGPLKGEWMERVKQDRRGSGKRGSKRPHPRGHN
jgi:hypothetical protein